MPTLTLDGDARGAVKAHADLDAAVKRTTRGYSDAGREAQNLEKAAKRIVDENMSPLERMQAKLREVANAYAMGRISADEQAKAIQRIEQGFLGAGSAHKSAFGSDAVQQLASYAAGFFGIQRGIQAVTEALHSAEEERKTAAANVAGGLNGAGELANVSPTQKAFNTNLALARRLMSGDHPLIANDQQDSAMHVAAGIVASGAAGGDQDFLLNLGRQQNVKPDQLGQFARSIAKVQQAYNLPAGSFQGIAKQFIAAGPDTLDENNSAADIGRYIADVSKDANEAGLSLPQTIASLVTNARETKSAKAGEAAFKEQLKTGDTFDGNAAAFYSQETLKLQGAPGGTIPDYIGNDTRLSSARGAFEAKGKTGGLLEQKLAATRSLYDTVSAEAEAYEVNQGWGGFHRALSRMGRGVESFFGGEEGAIEAFGTDEQYRRELSPDTLKKVEEHLGAIRESTERGDRSLPPPSGLQE